MKKNSNVKSFMDKKEFNIDDMKKEIKRVEGIVKTMEEQPTSHNRFIDLRITNGPGITISLNPLIVYLLTNCQKDVTFSGSLNDAL
jgi:hypothetical protein